MVFLPCCNKEGIQIHFLWQWTTPIHLVSWLNFKLLQRPLWQLSQYMYMYELKTSVHRTWQPYKRANINLYCHNVQLGKGVNIVITNIDSTSNTYGVKKVVWWAKTWLSVWESNVSCSNLLILSLHLYVVIFYMYVFIVLTFWCSVLTFIID